MDIITSLSSQQGRKDEGPNKELGQRLVEAEDRKGIQEVVGLLSHPDREIRIDSLGVLEQIGLLRPDLLEGCLDSLLELALGSDNRLVWQSMIVIAAIADREAKAIMDHYDQLIEVIRKGSVITVDNGVKILSRAAAAEESYRQQVLPYLIDLLRTCRSKSVPQYAESIWPAGTGEYRESLEAVIEERLPELTPAQAKRVARLLKKSRKTGK